MGSKAACIALAVVAMTTCSVVPVEARHGAAPTASFTFATDGLLARFDGSTSFDPDGDALSYHWTFGDGTSGTGVLVEHLYAAGGSFTVRLTVRANGQSSAASVLVTVAPINHAPVAGFTHDENTLRLDVDGQPSYDVDGDELTYSWDFGDGATGTGQHVSHWYPVNPSPAVYNITLSVSDGRGATASTTTPVSVSRPPFLYLTIPETISFSGPGWVYRLVATQAHTPDVLIWTAPCGPIGCGTADINLYVAFNRPVTATFGDFDCSSPAICPCLLRASISSASLTWAAAAVSTLPRRFPCR